MDEAAVLLVAAGGLATRAFDICAKALGSRWRWDDISGTAVVLAKLWVTAWILLVVSAVSAVALYWIVYCFYIPEALLSFPVHYEFPRTQIAGSVDAPSPAAVLRLNNPDESPHQALSRHQSYDIYMEMRLPESAVNVEAGMFMVGLAMAPHRNDTCRLLPNVLCATGEPTDHGRTSARRAINTYATENNGETVISRAASLRYRSGAKYWLQTAALWVPLMLGLIDEHQTLVVPLLVDFYDARLMRSQHLWAASTLSEPGLQVVAAELKIRAHFKGTAYLMHDWFFLTFIVTSGIVGAAIFAISALFVYGVKDWVYGLVFDGDGPGDAGSPIQMKELDESALLEKALVDDPTLRFDRTTGLYSFDVEPTPAAAAAEAAVVADPAAGDGVAAGADVALAPPDRPPENELRRRTAAPT